MCEREDGEGLQRRTKRRSSLAGRVGTRPGTKEAWLAFSLLSLKLRCVKTTRCGLFQAIPHSILFRPCILSGLRHSICLPIQCILYFWPFNCTLTASRPLPTQARPEKKTTNELQTLISIAISALAPFLFPVRIVPIPPGPSCILCYCIIKVRTSL